MFVATLLSFNGCILVSATTNRAFQTAAKLTARQLFMQFSMQLVDASRPIQPHGTYEGFPGLSMSQLIDSPA